MRRSRTGSERGLLAAGMLLAALTLAACESADDREIRALIEEIAVLQEQRITVMESTAQEEIAFDGEHDAGPAAQTERVWEERVEAFRDSHERTLTKLRETLTSGDWETAYAQEMALLNGSPLAIVAGLRDLAEGSLRAAEEHRAGLARSRERRAEIRRTREARIDAAKRVPRLPPREALSIEEVLGLGPGTEAGR